MKKLLFLSFLFFCITLACNAKSKYTKATLVPIDTIAAEGTTPPMMTYFDKKTKKTLFSKPSYSIDDLGPNYLNKITFYNIKNSKEEFSINIDTSLKFVTYTMKSPDSIFLMKNQTIYHYNRKGSVNKWYIGDLFYPAWIPEYWLEVSGHTFYFNTYPTNPFKDNKVNFYKNERFMGKVQIIDNKPVHFKRFLNLPDDYWKDSMVCFEFYPRFTVNPKNELIISFQMNDSLWVIDSNENVKKYPAKSKYFDASQRIHINSNDNELLQFQEEVGFYGDLIKYDAYRNLYYRTVCHNQKRTNKDNTVNDRLDRAWSVIILDENFNYIDEIFFPAKEYIRAGAYTVNSKGWLMQKRQNDELFEETKSISILYKLELK